MQGGTVTWADTSVREDLPLPPALEEALRSQRKLFMRYVDEFGSRTERWVSVMDVRAQKEYIYVRAFCHLRDAERSFRLDRVVEMKVED
jgi:predicted DNA-binding transcriptional regulator YafY